MRKATLSLLLLMTSFIFLATSCHEVEETIANVVVLNELGAPVQGASVRLFAFGSVDQDFVGEPRFDTTAVTNERRWNRQFQLLHFLCRRASRLCRLRHWSFESCALWNRPHQNWGGADQWGDGLHRV